MPNISRTEQGHEDLELWYHVEFDERSTSQLPRITYMQIPVTKKREAKAIKAEIVRSIHETFLMSKKEIAINQKEVNNNKRDLSL